MERRSWKEEESGEENQEEAEKEETANWKLASPATPARREILRRFDMDVTEERELKKLYESKIYVEIRYEIHFELSVEIATREELPTKILPLFHCNSTYHRCSDQLQIAMRKAF